MKRNSLSAGIGVIALLSLVGSANVFAIPIDRGDGVVCNLTIGETCELLPVDFLITQVTAGGEVITDEALDSRINDPFASVGVSIEALAAQEFMYRYEILEVYAPYQVNSFQLDLGLVPPAEILDSGSVPDADPLTVAPSPSPAGMLAAYFSALYFVDPIFPGQRSEVLFVHTTFGPCEPEIGPCVQADSGSFDVFDSLLSSALLQGPASQLVAEAQRPSSVPEPGTLVLLGIGLFGLAAGASRRTRSSRK